MATEKVDPNALEDEGAAALLAMESRSQGDEDLAPEAVLERMSRAQLIQVLDRGVVRDRLDVKLPADREGYWVRERVEDIERIMALGGRFETSQTVLSGKSLHGSEGDHIRVGDLVLMSLPIEVVNTIKDILAGKRDSLIKKGKKEFLNKRIPGVPHFEER